MGQQKYRWVDFACPKQPGFRNRVVDIRDVPQLTRYYQGEECFTTYFFYSDEVFAHMATHPVEDRPSLAGYEGKIWASFLPIDLDAKDLRASHEAAGVLLKLLRERWALGEESLHLYFSGAKGFHFLVDGRVFGRILPTQHLHQVFAALRMELARSLPVQYQSTVDLTIKDRTRLLRLPNTINKKTSLYKIQLLHQDLLEKDLHQIIKQAAKPAPLYFTDETGLVSTVTLEVKEAAAKDFARMQRHVRRMTRKPFVYQFTPKEGEDPEQFLCPALLRIWQGSINEGYRNNCAIRLASEFRLHGLPKEKTKALLLEWDQRQARSLPHDEIDRIVHSAYSHRFPYRYSCRDEIFQMFCPFEDFSKCEVYQEKRFGASRRVS